MVARALAGRLLAALAVAFALPGAAAGLPDREVFVDPEDGRFDASRWLLERKGFLPVPIVITEPALGYGAGLGALFFEGSLAGSGARDGKLVPLDITGVAGMGTENGSRGGAAFHLGYDDGRRWRYLAAAAGATLNLAWYGAAGTGGERAAGVDFNLESKIAIGDLRRRIGDSEWWVGLRYVGMDAKSRFALDTPGDVSARQLATALSGLGVVVEYDGRDNIFTPSTGSRLHLDALRFDDAIGSDQDFSRTRLAWNSFHALGRSVVLGVRAEMQAADGDVPFYAQPFIELRGVPALRYQGDRVALLELEGRWNLDGRWSAVAFAGAGRAAADTGGLGSAPTRTTFGVGFRYFLARALGLHAGLDVARGPEDTAIYLIAGSAWR